MTAVGALLAAATLAAQAGQPAEQPCERGAIARIVIDNVSIFDDSDPDRNFSWAYSVANALHVRTRASVLERELLFQPGDCYDPLLVRESARLLREFSFLSNAEITANQRGDGDWDVIVETRDDWSTTLDVRLRVDQGVAFEGARLFEQNVLGTGQEISLFYYQRDVAREYGVAAFSPQLLGTRWDMTGAVGRSRAGDFIREEVAYPFVGEVGRWAGRQGYARQDRYFDFVTGDDPELEASHLLVPIRDNAFDLALLRRIGQAGNSSLLGAGISYRGLEYFGRTLLAPNGNFEDRTIADSTSVSVIRDQHEAVDAFRFAVLLGHRNVFWVQRRGVDSMRGIQDIRLGAEIGLELSRSISAFADDKDLASTLSMYTAMESGPALFVARLRGDARRDLEAPTGTAEWKDLYADGELLTYLWPAAGRANTIFLRAAALAGWSTRTPFQLTLGGERGVRGYNIERFPGAQRVVFTVEDRHYLGFPFKDVLDTGTTLLADVGRVWAGDAPFGIDSGWKASAGFGIRASFPAGSRTTYRIDFMWPLERGTGVGDFRVRFSFGEPFGLLRPLPDFMFLRSRPDAVGGRLGEFR